MLNTEIKQFDKEGYVLLKNSISDNDLKILKNNQDSIFSEYRSGERGKAIKRTEKFYQSKVFFDQSSKVRVDGIPLKHRIFKGQGSPILSDTSNIFYGKRASKNLSHLDENVLPSVFNKNTMTKIKEILGSSSLAFLEGSVNRIYPGYSGENKIMHLDTYGFTYENNKILKEEDFFVNVLFFINGTGHGKSPTKIIPGSHKYYNTLNKIVAKSLKLNPKLNCIHQRELYEELLPDNLKKKIISVIAEPGDVLVINSNLVHGISANTNDEDIREAVILNFCNGKKNTFGKSRSKKEFHDLRRKLLPYKIIIRGNESAFYLKKIFLKIIYKLKLFKAKILRISILKKKKNIKRLPFEKMPFLNLGSGPLWKDPMTIGLDINGEVEEFGTHIENKCDMEFDLSSFNQMPFQDNRFDGVYSSHCFEHLRDRNAKHLMGDIRRILKPGGCFRVTVPNIDLYFKNYDRRNLSFFNWIKDKDVYKYDSWLRFITREFAGPVVDDYSDDFLIELYESKGSDEYKIFFGDESDKCSIKERLIPDLHKTFWTPNKMIAFLKEKGFSRAYETSRFESDIPYFCQKTNTSFNNTRPHISMYIEGIK